MTLIGGAIFISGSGKIILIFVALGFLSISCTKEDGSDELKSRPVESCVSSFFSVNYNYFFSPETIDLTQNNINCVDSHLAKAQEFLAQRAEENTTADVFQAWVNENFYKENPMSSPHLASWLLFKTWLVGGDSSSIRASEVKSIRTLLKKWKVFTAKSNHDLINIVSLNRSSSLSELKVAHDELTNKLDSFLNTFPNLISNFNFQSFVALIYQNKVYHNTLSQELNPSLLRSLIWFANGQETTVLSKNTSQFLMLCLYHYYKFRVQIGPSLKDILYYPEEFASFGIDATASLGSWLNKVKVFDYNGFKYLSDYLSKKIFKGSYSGDKVFETLKTINKEYLSEGYVEYLNGFGVEQNEVLSRYFNKLDSFNRGVNEGVLSLDDNIWTLRYIEKLKLRGVSILLGKNGFDAVSTAESDTDDLTLKSVHMIFETIEVILSSKATYHVSSLTKDEFESLLRDFSLFEDLWKVEGEEDFYEKAKGKSSSSFPMIGREKLFYFLTQKKQTNSFRENLVEAF